MKRITVPITPAMTAALDRLDEARRALTRRDRSRSSGQVVGDILGRTPVQSAAPDKQRCEEDPAPGREDTDERAQPEGLGNARSAGVFTSRCKG